MATKKKQAVSAHDLDRIIVRLPEGMRATLQQFADANGRSMTAEVVAALEEHFGRRDRLSGLEKQVEKVEGQLFEIRLRLANLEQRNDPAA